MSIQIVAPRGGGGRGGRGNGCSMVIIELHCYDITYVVVMDLNYLLYVGYSL